MRVNGNNEEMQRMANARLWKCIEDMGGIQVMLEKTGLSRQTLYGIKDNRSMPSGLTIGTLLSAVPKLDLNAIYAEGEGLEWKSDVAAPSSKKNDTTSQLTYEEELSDPFWKDRYDELKAYSDNRIASLEGANQALTQQHVELVKLFEGSPSHFTAYPFQPEPAPRMEVAGFGREPQNALLRHRFNLVAVGKRFCVAQAKNGR